MMFKGAGGGVEVPDLMMVINEFISVYDEGLPDLSCLPGYKAAYYIMIRPRIRSLSLNTVSR